MRITKMSMTDYNEAYQLWTSTEGMGLRSLDDSYKGIGAFLQRNPNTNFICRMDRELVGTILSGHDGRRGYIYHAVVKTEHRKKGIGKKLVNQVLSSLEQEGIKKVALVVYSTNQTGNTFWESVGFVCRDDLNYRNYTIDHSNI